MISDSAFSRDVTDYQRGYNESDFINGNTSDKYSHIVKNKIASALEGKISLMDFKVCLTCVLDITQNKNKHNLNMNINAHEQVILNAYISNNSSLYQI